MMSRGQWKDFFIEIRKSFSRYLSILFMVTLGTSFFAGLRSSEPDMKESLDAYLDQTGYMNIRVLSTLGMSEDDVTALGAIKGVTDAEGLYSVDVLSDLGDSPKVIHVQSITGQINQLTLDEGRMPLAPDECVADRALCDQFGLELGDRISVYSGKDDELGDDLEDSLGEDTFIITGIGISPDYLTIDRGTADIGTGSVSGFIAVDKTAFTAPAYTQVYVRADVLDQYNCFSKKYAEIVDGLIEDIEAIAGERCEIRLYEATAEHRNQIADAKEELAAGRAEAEAGFADAWAEIEAGQREIEEGKKALDEAAAQLITGKAEYEAGLKEINAALAQIAEGERQLAAGRDTLTEKQKELASGKLQLEEGKQQYEAGLTELESAKQQIEEGEEQLRMLEGMMAAAENAYSQAAEGWEKGKADLEAQQAALDEAKKAYEEEHGESWEKSLSLRLSQAWLDSQWVTIEQLEKELAPLKQAMEDARTAVDESRTQLEDGKAQYEAGVKQLEEAKAQIDASEAQIADGEAQIAAGWAELEANEKQLADGKAQALAGQAELAKAKKELEDGEAQIEAGRAELIAGEQELKDGIAEYEKEKAKVEKEFAKAEKQIAEAEEELAKIELPQWYVLDRNTVQNYVEYDLDAQKIGALAQVFPVLFFFVAALVSLTTMTRMVEEQRTLIGTMKALGYSSTSIAMKYILYALTATLFGSVLGVWIGSKMIPWVVITAYGILYQYMPVVLTPVRPWYALLSAGMAVFSTVGATWMACHRALTSQPASLMRPVAPTKGTRIFLERMPFIWKHLNFSSKSTLRNLFRYKKRLFMTLFGIGACMALLLVGYGVQDSIEAIVNRQYHTVWVYDMAVYLKDSEDEDLMAELDEYLMENRDMGGWLDVYTEGMEAEANGAFKSIMLLVPEDPVKMDDYIKLKSRTKNEQYALDADNAFISEKLAMKLSLEVGDTMTIKIDETKEYSVTVGAIVENYMQYYVYMSPEAYKKVFDDEPKWNQRLLSYGEGVELSEEEEERLSAEFLDLKGVTAMVSSSELRSTISTMLKALDYVVLVLIGAAGLLAFVVLYNLNNINITERKRELATIKLLGFYPGELAAYVYRENIILTALGIGMGVLLGTWLTNYVIETVEIDMIMFGRGIDTSSYIIGTLMTITFSVIVNVVMYYRLQKIDMIESLKSVE